MALVLTLVLGTAAACTSQVPRPSEGALPSATRWPTEGWPTAAPESEGFDSLMLAEALEEVRPSFIQLHSLLIIRRGSAVLDAYAYPYDGSTYHDLASVTKSYVSTLIGVAATQGKLDLDAPVVSFFPDRQIAHRDERKERITVRHLLSMSSGLDCSDREDEITLRQMRKSADWVQFALDLDMVAEPGTTFAYCSPGMHLLSAILHQATGMSALEFARANLFAPLGIDEAYWPSDPQGITFGWGDLALHPRDAAKLGFLYLHGGEWDGRQVVSRGWAAEATSPQVRTGRADDYGYGWWVSQPGDEMRSFRADGTGGQRILVVPSLDLVVTTTGGGFSPEAIFASIGSVATDDFGPLPANPAGVDRLRAAVAELVTGPEPRPVPRLPNKALGISGRAYVFEPNVHGVRNLRLDFGDPAEAILRLDLAAELTPRVDRVGLDGVFRPSRKGRPIVARGYWDGPRTFVVEVDEGPGLHAYDIRLRFTGRAVRFETGGGRVEGTG
ncbi:MAG TPA: serine hydrolase [Actinomycetota bacterium]|nr:serine hydrolase [Actinomycetota bacterium]